MKSERVWKSNLGDFESNVSSALYRVCVSLSLVSFYYKIYDDDDDDDYVSCSTPCSYRQPFGRGQLLSRRYCKHSGWLFLCASRTARESHGALAVSCKYFKQSKWPFSAAYHTHIRHIHHIYAQQGIRVCEDDHFEPPIVAVY